MNPRILTAVTGIITLGLGVAGLLYPDRVMGMLGFGIVNTTATAAVLGEVRATYGGLFVVMGIFTLLSLLDPSANRARLTFIGCMWLGAGVGRLLGTSIDGSPGIFGWLSVAFELLMGAALLAAGWLPGPSDEASARQPEPQPMPMPQPSSGSGGG
jgi:drug/metabolite transporter superfamily protein YnfA